MEINISSSNNNKLLNDRTQIIINSIKNNIKTDSNYDEENDLVKINVDELYKFVKQILNKTNNEGKNTFNIYHSLLYIFKTNNNVKFIKVREYTKHLIKDKQNKINEILRILQIYNIEMKDNIDNYSSQLATLLTDIIPDRATGGKKGRSKNRRIRNKRKTRKNKRKSRSKNRSNRRKIKLNKKRSNRRKLNKRVKFTKRRN